MVPILYEKTATVFDRTTIIGRLAETISCTVTEELNGIYEAELELPTTAKHYPHIMLQSIIVLKPNENDNGQPFRVYKISKPLNGIVTIYLEHISYDLTRQTAMPFYAHGVSAAMAGLKNVTIGGTKFNFYTDKIDGETFSTEEPRTVRNILGGEDNSFVTKYGGDLEFDHYNVRLLRNRGKDNGVQIRYGKNLTDLLAEDDNESVITACAPYYRDGEKTYWVSSTDGVVISSHYNGHQGTWQELIASGNETWEDVQRKRWSDFSSTGEEAETWQSRTEYGEHTWQDIQDYRWMDFMGGLDRIQPLDVTSLIEKPEDADEDWVPTEGEIARAAENYMNEKLVWLASSTLEVSFINLRDTEQYKDFAPLQNVGLCDTVHVVYNALGVNVSLKVVKTVYDGLRERYDDITLGNPKKTLAENIKRGFESTLSNITNEIEAKAGTQEVVDVVTKSQQEVLDKINSIRHEVGLDNIQNERAIDTERRERAIQYENLSEALDEKAGLYSSVEATASGNIYYFHDQPNRAQSTVIWKLTQEALGVSTDGGQHWNFGVQINGDVVARILAAEGINADWINSGAINADLITTGMIATRDGKNVIDFDTGVVKINATELSISGTDAATKTYADGKASTAESSAKTYADGKASTAESNAKGYADTKASTAESNAKTYADGKASTAESNAKSYADTKDAATLASAKSYAQAQDTANLGTAKYYADNAATSAVNAQTQLDIFNKLTNNQSNQGIYLNGNNLYLNASLLKTGIITDGAGYQQWDLVNKLFTSGSSSGTKFQINQGVIFFYYNGDKTGTIHPVGGSDTRGKGVAFAALSPANGTSMGGAGIFNYSDGSCYLEGKDSSNKNDTDNATEKTYINSTAWRRYVQMDIPTGWASAGTAGTDGKAMSALYLRNGLYQMGNPLNNTYKKTCAGWISNGAKTMNFVVRLPMRLHKGQTFTLNHLRGTGKCGTSICFDLASTPASHELSNPLDWTALSDCTVSVNRDGIAEDEIFVSITGREAFKSGYRAGATVQNESALTFIINYIDFTIS